MQSLPAPPAAEPGTPAAVRAPRELAAPPRLGLLAACWGGRARFLPGGLEGELWARSRPSGWGSTPLPGAPLCPPQPRGPTPPPSPRWPGLAVWLPQRTVSRTVPPETDPAPAGASSTRPTPQDLGAHGPAGQGVLRRRATSAGGGAGSAPGSSWGAGGSRAPAPHLCTGEGTHTDHLQHRVGGPQGAEQGEGVWVGAGAVSDHVLGAGCVGGEQGSGPWTSGVQASGGRRSVPRCGAGSWGPVWHSGQPGKGSTSGAKGTGPSGAGSPLSVVQGRGPRPARHLESPRVIRLTGLCAVCSFTQIHSREQLAGSPQGGPRPTCRQAAGLVQRISQLGRCRLRPGRHPHFSGVLARAVWERGAAWQPQAPDRQRRRPGGAWRVDTSPGEREEVGTSRAE